MLKEEIIEKISKYFKLTSYEAEKIYDDIFSIIVSGVKQDNIVDVANFGEFIIKFNDGNGEIEVNGYKKTAEFLATSRLEEDINQGNYEKVPYTPMVPQQEITPKEIKKQDITRPEMISQETESSHLEDVPFVIPNEEKVQKEKTSDFSKENSNEVSRIQENISKPVDTHIEPPKIEYPATLIESKESANKDLMKKDLENSETPVEEEMRKKREEILSKITKPLVERKPLDETKHLFRY